MSVLHWCYRDAPSQSGVFGLFCVQKWWIWHWTASWWAGAERCTTIGAKWTAKMIDGMLLLPNPGGIWIGSRCRWMKSASKSWFYKACLIFLNACFAICFEMVCACAVSAECMAPLRVWNEIVRRHKSARQTRKKDLVSLLLLFTHFFGWSYRLKDYQLLRSRRICENQQFRRFFRI